MLLPALLVQKSGFDSLRSFEKKLGKNQCPSCVSARHAFTRRHSHCPVLHTWIYPQTRSHHKVTRLRAPCLVEWGKGWSGQSATPAFGTHVSSNMRGMGDCHRAGSEPTPAAPARTSHMCGPMHAVGRRACKRVCALTQRSPACTVCAARSRATGMQQAPVGGEASHHAMPCQASHQPSCGTCHVG